MGRPGLATTFATGTGVVSVFLLMRIMFLSHRSTQTEYFDLPERTEVEIAASFRDLNRVNVLFRFSHPFEAALPQWLGRMNCERLEILDVGAGTGLLGKTLTEWARR